MSIFGVWGSRYAQRILKRAAVEARHALGPLWHQISARQKLLNLEKALPKQLIDPEKISVPHDATRSAVVVVLTTCKGKVSVLYNLRSKDISNAGQACFPGGRFEPADGSLLKTALREAEEENGLSAARLKVLGCLEPYFMVSKEMWVVPFVAVMKRRTQLFPDAREVADIFCVPLRRLLTRGGIKEELKTYTTKYEELQGQTWVNYHFEHDGKSVWGVTGYISKCLADCVRAAKGMTS